MIPGAQRSSGCFRPQPESADANRQDVAVDQSQALAVDARAVADELDRRKVLRAVDYYVFGARHAVVVRRVPEASEYVAPELPGFRLYVCGCHNV